MKLNLLPTHVSKSSGSKSAFMFMFVIIFAAAFGSFWLMQSGKSQIKVQQDKIEELTPKVQAVMGKSDMADTVIAAATAIDRNLKLVSAMDSHNTDYTDLYREVIEFIPSFYRINSLNATSAGPTGATVTMNGVLETSQQYADLVIALYRMPGVMNVSRSGFTNDDAFVPGLNEQDQIGSAVRPGEGNLPSDPEDRMAQMIQRASGGPDGFLGTGFGDETNPKGAMPGWSVVTITMSIQGVDIRTPNPRATIDQHKSNAAGGIGSPFGRSGG